MPARVVVVGGDAMEAEPLIDDGQCVLRGIDGAFLQGLEDLAARQHGHRGAGPGDDLAADAGEADLEAAQVGQRSHRHAKPAGGLGPGDAAQQRMHRVTVIERLSQLPAAALVPPGHELPGFHTERHRAEQRRCADLALVVAEPRVSGFDLVVPHGIGDAEHRHQLAGLEDVEPHGAAGRGQQAFVDVEGGVAQGGQIGGECGRHPPAKRSAGGRRLVAAACRSRGMARGAQGQAADQTDHQRDQHRNGGGPVAHRTRTHPAPDASPKPAIVGTVVGGCKKTHNEPVVFDAAFG
jgi:hypothetical protein